MYKEGTMLDMTTSTGVLHTNLYVYMFWVAGIAGYQAGLLVF